MNGKTGHSLQITLKENKLRSTFSIFSGSLAFLIVPIILLPEVIRN